MVEDNYFSFNQFHSGGRCSEGRVDSIADAPPGAYSTNGAGQVMGHVEVPPFSILSPEIKRERKYLPTFSDLVDRLTITQMKAVFIPERKKEYMEEMSLILHDLDLMIEEGNVRLNAGAIKAIMVIMLSNRFIWENESLARQGGAEQDKLLKLTHSINGVRNTAKNQLAAIVGGRHDYKIDCFAAELATEFGDWNVFNGPT